MRALLIVVVSVSTLVVAAQTQAQQATDPAIAGLIASLGNGDAAAKVRTADALGDKGAKAKSAVPALIKALESPDAHFRWHVERALGAIGPDAAPAVAALTAALGDQDPKVRAYAAFALGRIGTPAASSIHQLVAAVKDPDAAVRREVIKAVRLINAGPTVVVPLMIDILKQAQPTEVVEILHSLASFGDKVVPGLNNALKHENARYWASLVIAEIGPPAKACIPGLIECLSDDDIEVRRQAIMALGHIGPDAATATDAVAKVLNDSVVGARSAALWALGMFGPGAKSAMPVVEANLNDSDPLMRIVSAWAMTKIDPSSADYRRQAIARLLEATKSPEPRVRAGALLGLADLKSDDATTIQAFVLSLADADTSVAGTAANALAGLGAKAVAPLTQALASEATRGHAVALLGQLGPAAKSSLSAVLQATQDKKPDIQAEALISLAEIAPQDPLVAGTLLNYLRASTVAMVRHAAVDGLRMIGVDKPDVKDALTTASEKDSDPLVRAAAKEALEDAE
ncbi:MAG TPA: HEAT repeat domain-containing protein [Pirellulales bacterium]|nr:HEAT repeat domain-containing protein [Pirellulales bacterium]